MGRTLTVAEQPSRSARDSWGRVIRASYPVAAPSWRGDVAQALQQLSIPYIAYGQGRSYGDVCLNQRGALVESRWLDRLIHLDRASGVLEAEAGVTLGALLAHAVPQGWFLPVTPGTQFATLGGAIANDVHGKNHHRAGSFGNHVLGFELVRRDTGSAWVSAQASPDLFAATIGGLGLTGLIVRAQIQLRPIQSAYVQQETVAFQSFAEFYALAAASEATHEYTVAWLDCATASGALGRGLFYRANHAGAQPNGAEPPVPSGQRAIPFDCPSFALNALTVKAFNQLYYRKGQLGARHARVHYQPYFYPLDRLQQWNRLYGRRGFYQFQCVLPHATERAVIPELVREIVRAGAGSFLSVLKTFGDRPSPGWLSFARPGSTLALDFPNRGAPTQALFARLEAMTLAAGGALYPAKDGLMSAQSFRAAYPNWQRFQALIDPACRSDFSVRVGLTD